MCPRVTQRRHKETPTESIKTSVNLCASFVPSVFLIFNLSSLFYAEKLSQTVSPITITPAASR